MNFLKNYNENVVEYDLINKFNYKILNKIPKLKSITLTFKLKKSDTKTLISSLAALKLLIGTLFETIILFKILLNI